VISRPSWVVITIAVLSWIGSWQQSQTGFEGPWRAVIGVKPVLLQYGARWLHEALAVPGSQSRL
jgi:hypothetical protein